MDHVSAMLGLRAETSLHAGAGQAAGVIDLPIQREAHTDWPVVFGSAVKGAIRAKADTRQPRPDWIGEVFGPETKNASDNAGALLVSDARLLLLPVRSLTSHFKWVTCPALLDRLRADARRLGLGMVDFEVIPRDIEAQQAIVPAGEGGPLYLEEFRFEQQQKELGPIIAAIAPLLGENAEADLNEQLVVVGNDMFRHLARYATPVNPHICIDNKTKTVKTGALWYEESLPPDTLLYTCLAAQRSRVQGSGKTAGEVLAHVTDELFGRQGAYLQLGGNETVGMGWCRVQILRGEG